MIIAKLILRMWRGKNNNRELTSPGTAGKSELWSNFKLVAKSDTVCQLLCVYEENPGKLNTPFLSERNEDKQHNRVKTDHNNLHLSAWYSGCYFIEEL